MSITIPRPDPIDQGRNPNIVRSYVSYASWDFYSIRERLIDYVRNNFSDDFNDFFQSSYGIMIIEMMAHAMDMTSFKMDYLLNESYLSTAQLRQSLVRIAEQMGYRPRGRTCAQAMFSVTIPEPYDFDIAINGGYQISSADPSGKEIKFELYPVTEGGDPDLNNAIVIPAGHTYNSNIIGVEGSSSIDIFYSSGEPRQKFRLNHVDLIESWLRVKTSGIICTRVDFFNGQENQYTVTQDANGAWIVGFGDGVDGVVPAQGTEITISYRRGGGIRGNIVANFFNEIVNVITTVGVNVPVIISNYESGTGGSDAEQTSDIRKNAISVYRSQDRAVTANDYEVLTERFFPTVGLGNVKSKAVLRHAGCSANIIDIYVIRESGLRDLVVVGENDKKKLVDWLGERSMMTDVVAVRDAVVVYFNVSVVIRASKIFNRNFSELENKVRTRLNDLFALNSWSIGQSVTRSDIVKGLASLPDISFIDAYIQPTSNVQVAPSGDLNIKFWELARPRAFHINISFDE